jgi:hypothetical protein
MQRAQFVRFGALGVTTLSQLMHQSANFASGSQRTNTDEKHYQTKEVVTLIRHQRITMNTWTGT